MAYVDYKDVLEATNNGLDIIAMYYPDARNALDRRDKKFKIREERTASASLRLKNGSWHVTDFGGDQKERNAFGICTLETGKEFGEAVQYLAAIFHVKGADTWKEIKPNWSTRPLKKDEKQGDYHIESKEFTPEELLSIGPKVTAQHCKDLKFISIKSFTYCKENEASVTESTAEYPIFSFTNTAWEKIYQPLSYKKQYRFRFLGDKPKRHLFGLSLLKEAYEKNKQRCEYEYDPEGAKPMEDPKIDYVFIVSGGSDGLNLRSFGYFPIWLNSESEKITFQEYQDLKRYAKEIIYVPDLDASGLKHALDMSLKYLDVKIMMLPHYLTLKKDQRGNPCKDFKDFVVNFYRKKDDASFTSRLSKIITNAIPAQFWDETYTKAGKKYFFRNTQFYNFLKLQGFGRIKDDYTKDGYHFTYVDGNIVKQVLPVEIESFVHNFLKERQAPIPLRDLVYGQQLSVNKLNKLDTFNIKFSSEDREHQYMFFKNAILEISAEDIILKKRGEVDKYIWESKMHDHTVFLEDKHFTITKDASGNEEIIIHRKDNMYLNYLTNASRIHWRKELEDTLEDLKPEAQEKYKEAHKFNIAGPNLEPEEQYEQKLHLINKIYAIGYMLHTFKSPQKPWAVYAMDNKLADINESHGGSGKSVFQKGLQQILKKNHYIPGRDPKKTSDDFITHGITPDTDYVLVDDCHQYLDYGFFFSWITGDLEVNNKNGLRFVIPFDQVPKICFSSNYPPNNLDPSLARRLLYIVFSDYYHHNLNDEYRESRSVSDDFNGKSLFKDFDEMQWNKFYNFCAECIQFYLSREEKVEPPMNNVTMRNLLNEMGERFKEWADMFFLKTDNLGKPLYIDQYFSRDFAYQDFKDKTGAKHTPTKFKKCLTAFCDYNGYVFNPSSSKGYRAKEKRIIQSLNGESTEMFYVGAESSMAKAARSMEVDLSSDQIDDDLPFNN
jgi:hypothetical protein